MMLHPQSFEETRMMGVARCFCGKPSQRTRLVRCENSLYIPPASWMSKTSFDS